MDFKLTEMEHEYTDVLVIGSGVGGLFLSLKLSDDLKVVILNKGDITSSNTYYAQGGIAAVMSPEDSRDLHFNDTLIAGAGLCLPDAVRVLVDEGPERVIELINYGVRFDRGADGEIALTREGAHSFNRILHAQGDATGKELMESLFPVALARENIDYRKGSYVVDLLISRGRCVGAITLKDGEPKVIMAAATVLATGGAGQLYSDTTNPDVATGDGVAMAYRAGAKLMDMEFIQFHPTVFAPTPKVRFLISEAVRGEGAILRNAQGRRFMPDYHELAELAPRDVVARAILMELEKTSSRRAFLDLTHMPADKIKKRFPTIYETCKGYGVDMARDLVPVIPAAHYIMGGVKTDLNACTSIPGLYACGEVACTGVHGANRLASNSLLEALVFGARAAEDIARRYPHLKATCLLDDIEGPPSRTTSFIGFGDIEQEIKELMTSSVGIIRTGKGLEQARQRLEGYRDLFALKATEPEQFKVLNMIIMARLIVEAALNRKESVGSHYRLDSQEPSGGMGHIILYRDGDYIGLEIL